MALARAGGGVDPRADGRRPPRHCDVFRAQTELPGGPSWPERGVRVPGRFSRADRASARGPPGPFHAGRTARFAVRHTRASWPGRARDHRRCHGLARGPGRGDPADARSRGRVRLGRPGAARQRVRELGGQPMSVLSAAAVDHTDSSPQLVIAALLGIATVVVLIVWLKVHPFVSLILGSAVLGVVAGVSATDIITSFTTGLGATTGSVGLLIALGAMIGGLLTHSGGADGIVNRIVDRVSPRALPW